MESTFDYQTFGFGIIVGGLVLIILIRLAYLVYDYILRCNERKLHKQNQEKYEYIKRIIIEDTIKQLEDHANRH